MFNGLFKIRRSDIAVDVSLVGRCTSTIELLFFVGFLAFSRLSTAETLSYEIVPSESRYTYLSAWPQIQGHVGIFSDCQPSAYLCDFQNRRAT